MSSESVWVKDVGEADFEKEVIDRSSELPVVVDFWAPWCGPCRVLGPTLEKLAEEMAGGFLLAKVNVDEAPTLSQTFQIRGIPAVKAFVNGRPSAEFTGALPEPSVREFLEGLVPSEADKLVERAEATPATASDDAEALYRQALDSDSRNEQASVGLAEILMARGDVDGAQAHMANLTTGGPFGERVRRLEASLFFRGQAPDQDESLLVERVENNPDDAEALVDLGRVLAIQDRHEEALSALLRAAEKDRKIAQDVVKDLMVRIFSVVGERSELADDYRTKLSRILY